MKMTFIILIFSVGVGDTYAIESDSLNTFSTRGDILSVYETIAPQASNHLKIMLKEISHKAKIIRSTVTTAQHLYNNREFKQALLMLRDFISHDDLKAYKSLLFKRILGNNLSGKEKELEHLYRNIYTLLGKSIFIVEKDCSKSIEYLVPMSIAYRSFYHGNSHGNSNLFSLLSQCAYIMKNYSLAMKLNLYLFRISGNDPLHRGMSAYNIADLHLVNGKDLSEIMLWLQRSIQADRKYIDYLTADKDFLNLTNNNCFKEFFNYHTKGMNNIKCAEVNNIVKTNK